MKKLWLSFILALIIILSTNIPAFAIGNPDSIAFGTGSTSSYAVFENIYETGDMLFIAEGFVNYAVEPTDYTATQAFLFEVLTTAGNETILSTPLAAYGDRPIGIYQSAEQVADNGLVSGTGYVIRIRGNPLIFASSVNNTVQATLGAGDYFDNTDVFGGFTPLRNFVINTIATNMQLEDGVTTYKTTILGITYLTTTGGNLFLAGIPGLDTLEPSIFQASNEVVTGVTLSGNATYAQSLTMQSVWGTVITNEASALSSYLGMGTTNGGHIWLWAAGILIALFLGTKTQSPLVLLIIIAVTPLVGALLGLMSLAAALTISIIIIILGALVFARSVLA